MKVDIKINTDAFISRVINHIGEPADIDRQILYDKVSQACIYINKKLKGLDFPVLPAKESFIDLPVSSEYKDGIRSVACPFSIDQEDPVWDSIEPPLSAKEIEARVLMFLDECIWQITLVDTIVTNDLSIKYLLFVEADI